MDQKVEKNPLTAAELSEFAKTVAVKPDDAPPDYSFEKEMEAPVKRHGQKGKA